MMRLFRATDAPIHSGFRIVGRAELTIAPRGRMVLTEMMSETRTQNAWASLALSLMTTDATPAGAYSSAYLDRIAEQYAASKEQ